MGMGEASGACIQTIQSSLASKGDHGTVQFDTLDNCIDLRERCRSRSDSAMLGNGLPECDKRS